MAQIWWYNLVFFRFTQQEQTNIPFLRHRRLLVLYPSISKQLPDDAMNWGKQFTRISRKSLLFNNGQAWSKRNSVNSFDVNTMGSCDGREICELVGLFILSALKKRFATNVGLYRDDGLGAINITSRRLGDKARKDLIQIFSSFGLKITAEANLKRVNFLDATFDLADGTYKPYRKPNDHPLYINAPSIISPLPCTFHHPTITYFYQ